MASPKINVLFLPKWYPSKFDEFDGNFIENHAKTISDSCKLGLIFVHSDQLKGLNYKLEKSSPNGFTEYRIFYKRPQTILSPINKIIGFYRYFKAQQMGYRHYKKEIGEAEIIHVHINGRSALLALYLKLKQGIPYILTEHWSGYSKENGAFNGGLRKTAYRYIARNASAITTVSSYLKNAMLNHGIKGNYSIVPNVVDTSVFTINKQKENKLKRIVHISNLSTVPKNMPLIIDALDSVGKKREDFVFDLIGTGKEENTMLAKLNQSSIKNRYHFYGEIQMTEVAELLAKADFLLLYSQYETQSVVLIEAFACGVPVLTSAVGGIPEYMNSERGMMIKANDMDTLVQSIEKMLNTSQQFDPKKLRDYSVKNFSDKEIKNQFLNLYQTVLNKDD